MAKQMHKVEVFESRVGADGAQRRGESLGVREVEAFGYTQAFIAARLSLGLPRGAAVECVHLSSVWVD